MDPTVFLELSEILLIAVVVTGVMKLLKQPAIIGYILSGILAGPYVFNIIDATDTLSAFSQIGVVLLLFLVGINLNPRVIKDVGKISLITGLGQVLFTTSIGYGIVRLLGFSHVESLYVAIGLAFSSTIVIMKLLSDKKDLDTLYGRISMGFLIVQDFVAIFILLFISSIRADVNIASFATVTILKGLGGVALLVLMTIFVLPRLTKLIAKSQEYLLLFSISWCFIIATAFHYLNFSIEAGALLAGITLSVTPYHYEISSKTKPLRDFFLVLFFIMLGSQMVFSNILQNLGIIILLSFFVLIGNPIIVMSLMGLLGYTKRNSFLAGLTVAQISEFSFIVVSLGMASGHVSSEILSLITSVGLITFAGSTYLILYSHKIYPRISKFLSVFERRGKKVDEHRYHTEDNHDIILIGCNRVGFDILESLKRLKKKFLVIDYDPDVVHKLSKEGYDCRYGDSNDVELLDDLNFNAAKMVISTISDMDTNMLLISKVKEAKSKTIIAVVAFQIDDATKLYDAGATYVIMPHFLGGQHFSTMIEKNKLSMNKFLKDKIVHLEHIDKTKNKK